MLFPTFTFAVFFCVVILVGWKLHARPVAWQLFMVAASYVFYAWWNAWFVLLIVASTLGNTICGRIIQQGNDSGPSENANRLRKLGLTVAVVFNLGLLGVFKYFDFFIRSIQDGLESFGLSANLPLLRVILPVGISFFTFQALSYVIDIYRQKISATSLLQLAVYLAFFPQLVAGPIVRASEFFPQLERRLNPADIDFTRAAVLISLGLFKKVVVATYLAGAIVDDVFAFPERFSGAEILLGVYGYAVQIYADFSGYTDIAIGVALLLGFKFPENFNQPYRALSVGDFWRRWHITLSSWLRDYLYIPLGGNRGGKLKRDRNMFLVMLLGGLWHGAAWTFVIWGAYQGVGLVAERRFGELGKSGATSSALSGVASGTGTMSDAKFGAKTALRWLATFHFVCLGWIFFRSETLGDVIDMLGQLVTSPLSPAPNINQVVVWVVIFALVAQIISRRVLANLQILLSHQPVWALAVCFGIWMLAVDQFGPEGVAPFIYFQF